MPQAPARLTTASQTIDNLLVQLGPEGLAIELERRGFGSLFHGQSIECCTIQNAIWEYQESLRFSPIADKSKKTYLSELGQFTRFLEEMELLNKHVSEVLVERVFGDYLAANALKPNTRNKKVAVLRNLFNFAKTNKWVDTSMPNVLKTETVPPSIPKALSQEAVNELMELTRTTRYAHRFFCLTAFMLATGTRIGEAAGLRIGKIDFSKCQAIVNGKNHPLGRTVFMGEQVLDLLRNYIETTFGLEALSDPKYKGLYVFSARKGETPPNIGSIQETFRGLVAKMTTVTEEEKKHLTPHCLRHTYASNGLECGLDLYTISVLLGHRNISTTTIYTHLSNKKLQDAVEKTTQDLNIRWR